MQRALPAPDPWFLMASQGAGAGTADSTDPGAALRVALAAPGRFPDAAALARYANVAPAVLDALARTQFHLTLPDFLVRARVRVAAAALAAQGAGAAPPPIGATHAEGSTGEEGAEGAAAQAGFANVRALARATRRYLGMAPADYSALRHDLSFTLALPPRFSAHALHHLLARDPTEATERATWQADGTLLVQRGLQRDAADGVPCLLEMQVGPRLARCSVHAAADRRPAPTDVFAAHRQAVRLLGYASEPAPLRRAVQTADAAAWFAPVLAARPGLRVPLMGSAWEALVWAVLGQQVNLAFAARLRAELIRLAQRPGPAPASQRLLPHPRPADVARLDPADLHRRRFSRAKAGWIVALAEAIAAGRLDLEALADGPAATAHAALVARKGVGAWTAQYVLLRGMGFNDCVPAADAGLMRQLQRIRGWEARPTPDTVAAVLAPLTPSRSVACQHVWSWAMATSAGGVRR